MNERIYLFAKRVQRKTGQCTKVEADLWEFLVPLQVLAPSIHFFGGARFSQMGLNGFEKFVDRLPR